MIRVPKTAPKMRAGKLTSCVATCAALLFSATYATVPPDASDSWTSAAKPSSLAGGAVTFTYAGDAITSIAATPTDGGTIYLDGDAMPLAADATISILASGRLVISNAVTCAGDLSASGCGTLTRGWHDGLASTLSDATQALLPSNAFVTLFEGMDLDEWEPVAFYGSRSENKPDAELDPTGAAGWNVSEGYDLLAEYVRRETVDGVKQMEVQLFHRGSYVCDAVKVLLKQDGANVVGKLLGAWRGGKNAHAGETIEEALLMPPRVSFNSSTNDFAAYAAAVPGHVAGLGVAQLTMRRLIPEAVLEFDGKLTVPAANKVSVAENLGVEGRIGSVTTDNGGDGTGVLSPNFQVNGTFRVVDNVGSNGCLHGQLSGTGDVWLKGSADVASSTTNTVFTDYYYNKYLYQSRAEIVATFRYPFDITNSTALFVGTGTWGGMWGKNVHPTCYNMKKSADDPADLIRIGQYQAIFDNTIFCAYVCFTNDGTYLRGQYLSAWSVPNETPYTLGMDFDSVTGTATSVAINTSGVSKPGLGLRDTTYSFVHPRAGYVQLKNSTAFWNTMSGSPRFIIEGTDTRTMAFVAAYSNALPPCGTIDVRNGGWLQLRARAIDGKGYNGGNAKIIVRKGGQLWTHERYPFADGQKVFLDGGELRLGVGLGQGTILSWPYVEYLVMKDGARVCGNRMVTGNRKLDPYITVCGSEPSTFDSLLTLQATQTPSAARHFQWRVADVTGDDAADLVMNGNINCFNDNLSTNTTMHKYGDGTILMNGQCLQYGKTLIYEGTWKFGPTGDANGKEFVLRGGTLAVADGTENAFAALEVGAEGGTIQIGDGARLAFAAGTGKSWDGIVTIDTGSDVLPPDALRFGEDAHGLSGVQVKKLQFNGRKVRLTSAGYVTDTPKGLTMVVK